MRACCPDGVSNGFAFVTAEVVEDNDVAGFERRDEKLLHIGGETDGVDGAIENHRGVDPVMAERGKKGQGLPMAVRHLRIEPLPAPAPAMGACHVGLGPGLVDKHQALGIDLPLVALPTLAPPRNVRPVLLAGKHAFF